MNCLLTDKCAIVGLAPRKLIHGGHPDDVDGRGWGSFVFVSKTSAFSSWGRRWGLHKRGRRAGGRWRLLVHVKAPCEDTRGQSVVIRS